MAHSTVDHLSMSRRWSIAAAKAHDIGAEAPSSRFREDW
jgi:hypothetical protein